MRKMDVLGVRVELPNTAPMLLLKETAGVRFLPIWLGASEATAIASALEGDQAPRPLTHDLFATTLRELGQPLTEVHVNELADGTFYASLLVGDAEIDARPSDAIALALRFNVPVLVADDVLDEAGVELAAHETEEADLEAFREFLDNVDADDFDA